MKNLAWIVLAIVVVLVIVGVLSMTGNNDMNNEDTVDTPDTTINDDMDQGTTSPEGIMAQSMVTVEDQEVDSDVTVSRVNLSPESEMQEEMMGGFVVVHRTNADGSPVVPQSIGHEMIDQGMNTDVTIDLDEDVSSGDQLVVMLHRDTNGNGEYEFGIDSTDVDTPVTLNGEIVLDTFMVQ